MRMKLDIRVQEVPYWLPSWVSGDDIAKVFEGLEDHFHQREAFVIIQFSRLVDGNELVQPSGIGYFPFPVLHQMVIGEIKSKRESMNCRARRMSPEVLGYHRQHVRPDPNPRYQPLAATPRLRGQDPIHH